MSRWSELAGSKRRVSVNISSLQLQQPHFVAQLEKILRAEHIHPDQFQLEITENILMEKRKENVAKLNVLQKKGFRIAIDDFGTGYSSLSYLKTFPIDVLKVDKSFIKDLPEDEADKAIVKATIRLGTDLGLEMVAEGVESMEAAAYLRAIGCHVLQGFYFAKPMPFNQLLKSV
ncbi:EAL domain-containing protein [Salisediminibacterium beveridgei]|uniref:EAL domain-containing protein n=1 Tax=Salisediminibacterium beveridgei TaxID=632773 RepID=UPI0008482F66|nr:EAL domain-containing protein [Salisediminibacterium beveridgei]